MYVFVRCVVVCVCLKLMCIVPLLWMCCVLPNVDMQIYVICFVSCASQFRKHIGRVHVVIVSLARCIWNRIIFIAVVFEHLTGLRLIGGKGGVL